jgi:hypothetical protein
MFGMVGNAIYDRYLYLPVGITLAIALVHKRWIAPSGPPQPAAPAAIPPPPAALRPGRGADAPPRHRDTRVLTP